MIQFLIGFLTCLSAFFRSRYNLGIEILALRQQLCVLKRKHPRPRLRIQDRIFWILLRRFWPAWSNILVIVKPETVVAWHRAGFRLFWRIRSRAKNKGRPKTDAELRRLIQCILCRYRHKMHWAECRRFSLPEFKRFGSFPDGFTFAGEFPEGIRQIGNCVPPLFMRAIARHIRFEMLPVARRQDAAA